MKNYDQVERYLKSCLKKSKQFGFTIGLLVAFLISGGAAFAEETLQRENTTDKITKVRSREEIQFGIQKEKENVSDLLKKNQTSILGVELKVKQLLQRGAFWVKPLENSYQFFFQYDWGNYSKNPNRTVQNFKGSEYVEKKSLAEAYGQTYKGINYGAYGIIKNPIEFVDSIDFGANIVPKVVGEKSIVEKTVTQKTIDSPIVTPPTVTIGAIGATTASTPTITAMVEPNQPSVTVVAPGAIPILAPIEVTPVASLDMEPEEPTVSSPATITAPTVEPPTTPEGFNPRLIAPPDAPENITIVPPTITPPILTGSGANPTVDYYYWNGNKGAISQVSLKGGTFDIKQLGNTIGVNNYQAEAFSGTNPSGEKPANGDQVVNQQFFHTLLNVPYSEYSEGVTINNNRENFTLINLETEGTVNGNLEDRVTDEFITTAKKDALRAYQTYSQIKGQDNTELLFVNKGIVNLNAANTTYLFTTSHNSGEYRTNYLDNEGKITAAGENSIIIKHSPDTSQAKAWIYSNSPTGTMEASGKNSVIYAVAYKNLPNGRAGFFNEGTMKISGEKAIGVIFPEDTKNSKMQDGYLVQLKKAASLTGKNSMGFVAQNTGVTNEKNLVKFDINAEEAVGILQDVQNAGTAKTAGVISITGGSKNMGIYGNQGTLELVSPHASSGTSESAITMENGNANIGILATNASTINFDGKAKITGGTMQKLAVAVGKGNINIKQDISVGAPSNYISDSISLYSTDESSKIKLETPDKANFYLKDNSVAAYANNTATIEMSRTTLNSNPTIDIQSNGNKGIGLFANAGGQIDAKNHYINVKDGSVGIASTEANSSVNFTGGKLVYDSSGYAVYSDGKGKIDLSDAELTLKGKSTAFDVDLDPTATLPITMTANTRIKANSDDVIVFNLKNATNLSTVNGIEDSIKGSISTKLSGVSLDNLFSGSTSINYKVAAVDGGNITIGSLDKTGISSDTTGAKKDGFQYYNRFLGQRLVATTASGSTISAKLNNIQAANFSTQVAGLEMNSSKLATNVNETAIKLVNSTIEAERTESGNGAVGAFINYGQVNVDNNSKILVEQENNNSKAVGIYAVNGSQISNNGEIKVGGNQSIGILGQAYRDFAIGKEFGGKPGEGTITIQNNAKIDMTKDDSIGIYANNNNTSSNSSEHIISNTGTITIANSVAKTAIGMYGDTVTIKPENGNVNIGNKAVGIYALNSLVGEAGKNLGTVDFQGEKGVALYLAGNKNNTKLQGNKISLKNSGAKKDNVGLFFDFSSNAEDYTTDITVDSQSADNITSYYTKSSNLTVKSNGKINKNSVGIAGAEGKNLTYGDGSTIYALDLGEKSTGILGHKSDILLKEKASLKLNALESTGVYSNADGVTGKKVSLGGSIQFDPSSKKSIGIYVLNGTELNFENTGSLDFASSKNNIGFYLAGANFKGNSAVTSLSYDHAANNIYLYAQGAKDSSGIIRGSNIKLNNALNINPSGLSINNQKVIGLYLNTAVKGENTAYADNTLDLGATTAKINVTKEGIGVYTKNDSPSNNNIITSSKISSSGEKTVGIYTDGNLKLASSGNIDVSDRGVGIYGNKGSIHIAAPQNMNLTNKGTGVYLTNGSHLNDGSLTLKNNTIEQVAAGVYYTKGTATSEVEHNTELNVNDGNDLVALYADGGVNLKNAKKIKVTKGNKNVGAFITGGSELKNNADIILSGTDLTQAIGVYVTNGKATNVADKTIKVEDNVADSLSIGMAAVKDGTSANATNKGNIEAIGDAIGMYLAAGASGRNSGTISAKNSGDIKAIATYVKGNDTTFANNGNISSENVALALKDTASSKITNTGSLELKKTGAVGVYADNSVIDFNISPTLATDVAKTVALYATGNTKIKSAITSAAGKSNIGVYVDSNAEFETGSKIIANNGGENDFAIAVYTKPAYNKTVNTDIEQKGASTIGFYLGNDESTNTGSTITHVGTIDSGSGIGAYVPKYSKFIAQNTSFKVANEGTAVYLKGGDVDLGATGTAKIDFGTSTTGRAIYQDGGTITTGAGLTILGTGSFLALKNANSTINSLIKVGANGIGINGAYDKNGVDYTLTLGKPDGNIQLAGDKATGIVAITKDTVSPNKVDIINKGIIQTTSGEKTTGIYGVGANIYNQIGAKLNIGTKGIGIYTTNENSLNSTILSNKGDIQLLGDEATGIVAIKANTDKDFTIGEISGLKDKLVGVYFKDSLTEAKVKDFTISLGKNAKGLIFENGQDSIVTSSSINKINIGDTIDGNIRGIGISALNANVTASKTDVVVGKGSLGLYTKDKTLTFDLSSGKLESSDTNKSSILAYADGNTSEIALNGGGILKVGENGIALGAKAGKVTANSATTIEIEGTKGLGAYLENGGSINNNFDIKVKSAKGIGMYAKDGDVADIPKVSEIKGNNSIAYVFENINNSILIPNSIQLTDSNSTGQVGVVTQGTGNGLTVNGISVIGSKNTGVYSSTGKAVTNNGTLTVGNSTRDSSIGIYSKAGEITSAGNASIGKNSIGIYAKEAGASLTGNMTIGEKGVGIYLENTNTSQGAATLTGNVSVGANGAIGIQAKNAQTILNGNLDVASEDSKGIFSLEAGSVETKGDIQVGINSVGIYKNGSGEVKTATGKTLTISDQGYGIFSKAAKVNNNMNIIVGKNAIGAYVDGNDLTSIGNILVKDKGVGLLIKGARKTLTSNGNIAIGSNNSVGLYASDNASIIQNGNITIADNNGIGVYSIGAGNITTSGNIFIGKDAIGIYKDGSGTVNIGSSPQNMTVGEKAYGIYSKGSVVNSNMAITLGKEAVGIYARDTSISQVGDMTVGETTIGSNGFSEPNVNKNSIGIFGDNSSISYKGHMTVDKALSVGIYGANGGNITLKTGSIVDVKNGAYGIMTGKGVGSITIEPGAVINVDGKAIDGEASAKNVSFGIAAYSGDIHNRGTINITNGATGIYIAGTSKLMNQGTIHIGTGGGKEQDKPGVQESTNIPGIKITDKGEVTIGEKVINGGAISIDGDLTMQGLGIDVGTGKTVIDAKSISGIAFITPNFSNGTNEQKITIKDVFRTPYAGIGAFSGDIKSQSVSWVAKISDGTRSEHEAPVTKDIVMARIPYQTLIAGEKYRNLASGLEESRKQIPEEVSSSIFKSFDQITSHGEFARAVANVRGDVYSNTQERMKTIESVFEKSYREVLDSYNLTRDANKFSIINVKGKHEDNTLGVADYDYNSVGVLYLNDREGFRYGEKYGWSAGLVGSYFDFKGDTSKDSKEKVVSGKLGFHYQRALDREDNNAQWKWLSKAELTLNRHRMTRNSYVGGDKYQYQSRFWSGEISWKNKVFYDYEINTRWSVQPYIGIDTTYGHIFNISENGNELKLQAKGKDSFVITPKVGLETKYIIPLRDTHQAILKADAQYLYDITKLYSGANKAKIKDSGAGYYNLTEPEFRRSRVAVGVEVGYEKENNYGVTLRAEYQGNRKSDLNYSVRFNYKF